MANALTTPKLTMKETTSVVEAMPNSSEPISGTTVRSIPTMPPTKALIRTSKRELRPVLLQPESDRRGSLWTGYSFGHGSGRGRRVPSLPP